MDSFEWNKIAGWILAAAVAILGVSIFSGILYRPDAVKVKGYKVEGVEEVAATGPAEAEKPIAFFLAAANPTKGEAGFKKCQTCHNAAKGGPNAIGPNLWGVVGRPIGKHPGFEYSSAIAGHGGSWTWDDISHWIANPKTYQAGNKMAFAGISNPQDRADIIAYLNTQADSPLPLPKPPAETAAAPAADAKAGTAAVTPTAEKAAPAAGKAPDTREGTLNAAAKAQPDHNISGPGAPEVSGTSERETK